MEEKGKMVLDKEENQIDVENNQVDEAVFLHLDQLLNIQDGIDKINQQAADKILEIERRYDEKFKPLYAKRNECIKNIVGFWRIAILEHPVLRLFLKSEDREIFEYFDYLEVKDVESGYSITFNFKPNSYFKNTSLGKTFTFCDNGITKITATPIDWEENFVPNGVGQNMTATADDRFCDYLGSMSVETNDAPSLRNKKSQSDMRAFRYIWEPKESFFTWFSPPEQIERIEDFEDKIADTIKEDLWPNILSHLENRATVQSEVDNNLLDDTSMRSDVMVLTNQDDITKRAIKKSEVENNQLDDTSINSYVLMLKNQDDIDKINEQAMDEVFQVERWHNDNCKTTYDKRKEIIGNIPDFWKIAFLSHPILTTYIKVDDEEIFEKMTSLEVEGFIDENPGYSITFIFKDNDHFENTQLRKTFKFLDEGIEVTTTPIRWKEGKVPRVDHKTVGNRMPLSDESFFAWFSLQEPTRMWGHLKDVIADSIKEDLWPNPISYFYTEEEADNTPGVKMNRKIGRIEDNHR